MSSPPAPPKRGPPSQPKALRWNMWTIGGEGGWRRRFYSVLARAETVTMIVQVNGKVRDRIEVDADITEEHMERTALASDRIQEHLAGRTPRNVIIVRPKLVNIVG